MTILSLSMGILGYLSGSLPFGLWITRKTHGIDIREGGSGHLTATNAIRQAGWGVGLLVFLLDVAKAFIPVSVAIHLGLTTGSIALTGALAVIGHCWPVFAQFRGGKGLAVTAGILLALSPLALLVGVGLLIFFVLVIHHAARGSLVTALVLPFVFWWIGLRGMVMWTAVPVCLVIAGRYTVDWKRSYRELWLDREKQAPRR